MKKLLRPLAVTALCAVVSIPAADLRAVSLLPPTPAPLENRLYRPGEVLVKFKSNASGDRRAMALGAQGHAPAETLNRPGLMRVAIPAEQTVAQAVSAYQNDPSVEYAQPNYIYRTTAVPDDALYSQLWAFKNNSLRGADINVERAWDHVTDCSGVLVAVVDTGVNYRHEELAGNMWDGGAAYPRHGYDFVDNDDDPMDLHAHGTHVAGIIGAGGNNATGVAGVCWKARIMAVRAFDWSGSSNTALVVQATEFAVTHGAKIINMSFGGIGYDPAFNDALRRAQDNDVVVVAAAGNNARDNDVFNQTTYPCGYAHANIVCVAALDQSFGLAAYSNYGRVNVDVAAPGNNILSAVMGAVDSLDASFQSGWAAQPAAATVRGWLAPAQRCVPVDDVNYCNEFAVNPPAWPNSALPPGTDERLVRSFDLSAYDHAVIQAFASGALAAGEHLYISMAPNAEPFGQGGVELAHLSGPVDLFSQRRMHAFGWMDLSRCLTATCALGWRVVSAAGGGMGIGIPYSSNIRAVALKTNMYDTLSGTSMAAPQVAGLAALLRAYQPQYTAADVVQAITQGARPLEGLRGKIATGAAVDVMRSLAYVAPPTGLSAVVP